MLNIEYTINIISLLSTKCLLCKIQMNGLAALETLRGNVQCIYRTMKRCQYFMLPYVHPARLFCLQTIFSYKLDD